MREKSNKFGTSPFFNTEEVENILLEERFWVGYRRGLSRHLFGTIFAVKELEKAAPDTGETRDTDFLKDDARAAGYSCGSKGLTVEAAAECLRELLQNTGDARRRTTAGR